MLLPACTGIGLFAFVIDRAADGDTYTLTEALLLLEFESPVTEEATESVCVIVVPDAVLAFTVTTKVKLAVALAARVPIVQVSVTVEQVQPAGPVRDTAVVFVGSGSVKVTVLAEAGPALVTVWV